MKCIQQQRVKNVVGGHINLFFIKQKYVVVQGILAVKKLSIFCTTADGCKMCLPSSKKKAVRGEILRNTAIKHAII
jgi:hypothetical protein